MMTETPPNIDKCKVLSGSTMAGIEKEINDFLATKKPFKDVPLILTADGRSRRHSHRGITIREWHHQRNVRFDAAVELLD
jgi:hypothetical protein